MSSEPRQSETCQSETPCAVAEQLRQTEPEPMMVVWLVHGTFATVKKWPRQSKLLEALKTEFPGAKLKPFAWRGRNLSQNRFDSSERLRNRIHGFARRHPSTRHFIVAHSHGSQVALYTMRDLKLQTHVSGLVAMGSPFLDVRRRDISVQLWALFSLLGPRLVASGLAMIAAFFAMRWLLEDLGHGSPVLRGVLIAALVIGVCSLFVLGMAEEQLKAKVIRHIADHRRFVTSRYGFKGRCDVPMLFQTCRGDEAFWHLRAMLAVSSAVVFVVKWGWIALGTLWMLGVSMFLFAFPASYFGLDSEALVVVGIWTVLGSFVAALPLLALEVIVVLAIGLFSAAPWVIGNDPLTTHLCMRFNVLRIPSHCTSASLSVRRLRPGRWRRMLNAPSEFLAHCAYYSDDGCISEIVSWIRNRA